MHIKNVFIPKNIQRYTEKKNQPKNITDTLRKTQQQGWEDLYVT